jgi:hypothetical protein
MLPSALSRCHEARRIRRNTDSGPLHSVRRAEAQITGTTTSMIAVELIRSVGRKRHLRAGRGAPKTRPRLKYIHALDDALILRKPVQDWTTAAGSSGTQLQPSAVEARTGASPKPKFQVPPDNCRYHRYRREAHGGPPRAHNWRWASPDVGCCQRGTMDTHVRVTMSNSACCSRDILHTSSRRCAFARSGSLFDLARDRDGHVVSHAFSAETGNPTFMWYKWYQMWSEMSIIRTAVLVLAVLAANAPAYAQRSFSPPSNPQSFQFDPWGRGPPPPPDHPYYVPRSEIAPPMERIPQVAPLAPRIE